ncbi:MAG: hypothetical protein H7211_18275 [Aquabacterium sp.]|nr:hypothetical protein [Ferruginibacter sp.]
MTTPNNRNLFSKIFIAVAVLFTLFIYSCNDSSKEVKTETVTTPVTTDTMMKMHTDTMKHDTSGKDKGGQPTPPGN